MLDIRDSWWSKINLFEVILKPKLKIYPFGPGLPLLPSPPLLPGGPG